MLAKLRAQGSLREIRFDDLRLDDGEVAALLNDQMGIGLDRVRRWPADRTDRRMGRRGAARRAVASQPRRPGAVHRASSPATTATSPTTCETRSWPGCPNESDGFLLATAILDRFDAPLCQAVYRRRRCPGPVLEELDRLNLFIIPLDHRRQWFRYHHLFAEWLRLQADDDPRPRHRRAADWLADHGLPGDAIRHYVAAGEPDRGAEVIDRDRLDARRAGPGGDAARMDAAAARRRAPTSTRV